jgi:uncharacterized oxidoreductase
VPLFAAGVLTEFATRLLTSAGVPDDDAAVVANSLVGANLRGHDSHGVMRLPQYIGFLKRGEVRIGVALELERQTPALVVCNGNWGLGQVQAHRLLDLVVPKAQDLGVAVGAARNCGHIGRVGEYAERVAACGLMMMSAVNNCGASPRVAPPGGVEPRLATNPFCAAVPTTNRDESLVVDFATSVVAEGKVRTHYISGLPVPDGWLLDHMGKPTIDPSVLYEPPLGTILPLGGAQSYKGFGLGLILELWAGGLSGGQCSQPTAPPPAGNNVVFLLLDPKRFTGSDSVPRQATQLAAHIRATPRARGVDAILLPGDPERASLHQRSAHGIPLDDTHWSKLAELADSLGIPAPA